MELYQLGLTPTHGHIDKKHRGVNLAAHSFVRTIGSVALMCREFRCYKVFVIMVSGEI